MSDPQLVEYIRSHLAGHPRRKIKEGLLAEGVPRADIDAAFREADGRSRRGKLRKAALVCAGLALLTGAFLALKSSAPKKRGTALSGSAQKRWDSEIESYKPEPYGPLTLLREYLPAALEEGDAARDYLEAAEALTSKGDAAVAAFALAGPGAPSRYGGLLLRVEAGARKRDCRLSGALLNPSDEKGAADAARKATVVALLAGAFKDRAVDLLKGGRVAEAEGELRKGMNVGRHLAEDWDPGAQLMGAALITENSLIWGGANRERGGAGANVKLARMLKELQASLPEPGEIDSILQAAMDPARLPSLSRYISEERLRRPYALLVLQAAAVLWGPEEIASAEPSGARRKLIESAAASSDVRLAASGRAYREVLGSVGRNLKTMDPGRRRDHVAGNWVRLRRLAESPLR
jgi:hypothetical protein